MEKKDSVDLITIEGKFIEGTPVKEIKIEDYPMDTQKMYSLGLISEEQLKGIAATGNREKNMYFTTFVMDPTEKGVKREKNKYKKSDIVMIQDLEPKEILEEVTSTSNKNDDTLADIAIETNEDEDAFIKTLFMITSKPVLYACNVSEDDIMSGNTNNEYVQKVKEYATKH